MDIPNIILNATMRAIARQVTVEELYLKDGGIAEGIENICLLFGTCINHYRPMQR